MWFWWLLACSDAEKQGIETETVFVDQDGDGYLEDDCDDANPSIHPGMEEICDGIDNNCDEQIDEEVRITFYVDSDGDGFGNAEIVIEACSASLGFVSNGNDCDDADAASYPGAEEVCDGIDNNCDEEIDEGIGEIFYVDSDGDGFGSTEIEACMLRDGISSVDGDCDDQNQDISPIAEEVCDGIDNDCDGNLDNDVMLRFYEDSDTDGFGNPSVFTDSCEEIEGFILDSSDCDDADSASHPGAEEVCDGADNDCNALIDDNVLNLWVWYLDSDGDGYGDSNFSTAACDAPASFYVLNDSDCDDDNTFVSPDAEEICDGIDNNCDEEIDDELAIDPSTWYLDADGDGYGNVSQTHLSCDAPVSYVADFGDCNDQDQDVFPGAQELCNNKDDDCDGQSDEEALNIQTFYLDADGDGYGTTSLETCFQPVGYAEEGGDCDDQNQDISPIEQEVCDGVDNNCDGVIDEAPATSFALYYQDLDGDGFGDPDISQIACSAPAGFVSIAGDCDDLDEDLPLLDQDCDGFLDPEDCDDSDETIGECSSCLDILEQGLSTGDGLYDLYVEGWGDLSVYCDMTNFGGGWTLAGHQHPNTQFSDTTADIGLGNFDPDQTFRYGNDKIQLFEPTLAWRITSENNGVLTDNAWFKPACVIDWGVYVGVYGQTAQLDADCGIAYTDSSFLQVVGGSYTQGNCSRGIGQNNSGAYCSIRMGSCAFQSGQQGAAFPCSPSNIANHSIKLWFR